MLHALSFMVTILNLSYMDYYFCCRDEKSRQTCGESGKALQREVKEARSLQGNRLIHASMPLLMDKMAESGLYIFQLIQINLFLLRRKQNTSLGPQVLKHKHRVSNRNFCQVATRDIS